MSPLLSPPRKRCCAPTGAAFTLLELLTVISVMAVLLATTVPAFQNIGNSRNTGKSAYAISDTLEKARTYALAHNTYVWVGFFEEELNQSGKAGTGRLVISVVGSKDNSNQLADHGSLSQATALQLSTLIKADNIHIGDLSKLTTTGGLASRPPADACLTMAGSAPFQFTYPLTNAQPTYRFRTILQFSPMGDASLLPTSPVRFTEIGLQPTHGNVPDAKTSDFCAIQIAGIGGQVSVYQP